MAQRISRAKRTLNVPDFRELGDLAVVLRVLSLIYHAGHGRRSDLTHDAIRLARQLTLATPEPEAGGLLALMLLQHARLPARTDTAGRLVTLDEQDRSLWTTAEIAEGVDILQRALADERPGRYQILAAIAALHDDARTSADTDWPQILAWYDDLVALSDDPDNDDPATVLNRAVAVGHVQGAPAGLAETERVRAALSDRAQWHAVRAYLHELAGELAAAAQEYAAAAQTATEISERDLLVRRASRARARLAGRGTLGAPPDQPDFLTEHHPSCQAEQDGDGARRRDTMGSVRYLGDSDVRAALDMGELADALTTALVALSNGATSVPPRIGAFAVGGLLGAMPGFVPGLGLAAKLVTVFPGNARRSLPTHHAVIATFDPDTGSPLAVLDGTYITAIRTAMTSALAARALARPDSSVLAVVGSGVQARAHVVAFTHLLALGEIRIAARERAKADAVAATHPTAHAVDAVEQAVRGADIVCCCTDARDPVVADEWIADGTHVGSVGTGRELAPATIDRGILVVESTVAFQPPPAGAVELQGRDPATATELGAVLAGRAAGRPSANAVTVYKSTGHAVEDIAATSVAVNRAAALGLGTVLG